jgi:hypothetical protein
MAQEMGSDALHIGRAINGGWISRGFKLGIGFWLAGLFVAVAGFLLFVAFGATLLAIGSSVDAIGSSLKATSTAPVVQGPPDHRGWRERLKVSDDAIARSARYLKPKEKGDATP